LSSDGEGDYDEGFDQDLPKSPGGNHQEEFGGVSAESEEQEDSDSDDKEHSGPS
jgi:hypothetical protein